MEMNMTLKETFNYLFIVSMLMLPALGLFKYYQYMDYYEMFILVGTGVTFIWISNYWHYGYQWKQYNSWRTNNISC